jgi:multiple sugar transport system substrate-binding protein
MDRSSSAGGYDFRTLYLPRWLPWSAAGGEFISRTARKPSSATPLAPRFLLFAISDDRQEPRSPTYTPARNLFDLNKNEVALSLSGLYQEARMKKANPAFYESKDWMVIPDPQWKDAVRKVPNKYYGHYYMVNAQSGKLQQQAAWSLVSFCPHGAPILSGQHRAALQGTVGVATFKACPIDVSPGHGGASMVYYGAQAP